MAVSRAPHHHHHIHWAASFRCEDKDVLPSRLSCPLLFALFSPSSSRPLVSSLPTLLLISLSPCLSICYCLHILESKTKVIHLDLGTLVSLNAANLSLLHSTSSAFHTSPAHKNLKHPSLWSWPPSSPAKHLP
ncbi:hypothetical protein CGRA01v4_10434 [Colletotrichum graminicola]|nr:hypothetical protein CGRA01v4_10434 [Colletotrichum graminicola]